MLDSYKVITFTHHSLDISEIGKFVLPPSEVIKLLSEVSNQCSISEIVYLNTCNRVSFFLYMEEDLNEEKIILFFKTVYKNSSDADIKRLEDYFELYEGQEAITHTLEVSSAIDSLIVGESEITRQIRLAFQYAIDNKLAGEKMRMLETQIAITSKYVLTHTRINEKPLSIASISIEMALEQGLLSNRSKVLIIGAGETGELVLKLLCKKGITHITLCNRSIEKAKEIGKYYQSSVIEWNALFIDGLKVDAIFVATSSPTPLINEDNIALFSKDGSLLIADLSVPVGVANSIRALKNIHVINIDDLKYLSEKNLNLRKQEITLVKEIIKKHTVDFRERYFHRYLERSLKTLSEEVSKVKQKTMKEVFKNEYELLDQNSKLVIQKMLEYMEKKCVSIPMRLIKEQSKSNF